MATGEVFESSNRFTSNQDVLGTLGISKQLAQKRIEVYRNVAVNSTIFCRRVSKENIEVIIPGSRGEGTAGNSMDCDLDLLYVQRSVKCFHTFPSVYEEENNLISFLLDFEDVKSGYAMLRLISVGHTRTEKRFLRNIRDGLVRKNGYEYLRNDGKYISILSHSRGGIAHSPSVFDDRTGPARTVVCGVSFLEPLTIDRVTAFPVYFPSALDSWRKRKRGCNWPSKNLIEKASSLDIFVVPVGIHGSSNEVLQWRVSATMVEQALVHSFNDTQIKLYVAVKMIAKQELKPVCDNISSYLVKNVMFWVIEETEAKYFRRECFDDRLLDILKYLRRCIYWRYLPNYIFQSINMLESKIFEKERRELLHRLDETIDNCNSVVLLRLPSIKDMLYMQKEIFQKKIIFEQLRELGALAIYSIPPFHFEKLMKDEVINSKLLRMKQEEIVRYVGKHVFPIIRRINPYDYFNLLISMTDEEILYRLHEGVWLGFLTS